MKSILIAVAVSLAVPTWMTGSWFFFSTITLKAPPRRVTPVSAELIETGSEDETLFSAIEGIDASPGTTILKEPTAADARITLGDRTIIYPLVR